MSAKTFILTTLVLFAGLYVYTRWTGPMLTGILVRFVPAPTPAATVPDANGGILV